MAENNKYKLYNDNYQPYDTTNTVPNNEFLMPNEQMELPYQRPLEDTVTKWQLDNSDILTNIEYQLRGYRKINNEWKPPTKQGFALLNETGIASVMQLTQSVFNKIMNSTNFDDNEISEIGIYFSDKLVDMLVFNYNEYGIKRPQELSIITTIILVPFKGVLKQSYQDGTRRFLKSVMGYRESFQNQDSDMMPFMRGNQKKKGWSLFGG